MAVPKQKHTKSRRDKRRGQIYIKPLLLNICSKCEKPVIPHTVCFSCGYYKGQKVIDVMKKLTKKEKKLKEKEMAAKDEEKEVDEKKSLSWEDLSKK